MENNNISGNHSSNKLLNILKASLPFVPPGMQRGISYYVKIEEFNHMVRGFRDDSMAGLQTCGIPTATGNSFNVNEYIKAITPYLSKSEQDLIKMLLNVVHALKVYNIYKELDPSFASSIFTGNTESSCDSNHAASKNSFSRNNDSEEKDSSSVMNEELNDNVTSSDSPGPTAGQNPENQGINIEALKSMLSPSQRAMFETCSSLLN